MTWRMQSRGNGRCPAPAGNKRRRRPRTSQTAAEGRQHSPCNKNPFVKQCFGSVSIRPANKNTFVKSSVPDQSHFDTDLWIRTRDYGSGSGSGSGSCVRSFQKCQQKISFLSAFLAFKCVYINRQVQRKKVIKKSQNSWNQGCLFFCLLMEESVPFRTSNQGPDTVREAQKLTGTLTLRSVKNAHCTI